MQIQKSDLLDLISPVAPVADPRNSMAILGTVHLYGDGYALVAEATDLEVRSKNYFRLAEEPGLDVCVPAKKFFDIVKTLPEGDISLEVQDGHLHIQAGDSEFKLATMDPADFPNPDQIEINRFSLEFSAPILTRILETTSYAMAREEARYSLCGVCFDFSEHNKSYAVATDDHRLVLRELNPIEVRGEPEGQYIVPAKAVRELISILKKTSATVELAFSGSSVTLLWADGDFTTEFSARLIEGQFPEWRAVMPQNYTGAIILSPEQFIPALKRVTLLVTDRYKPVTLTSEGDKLKIQSLGSELGEAQESIPASFEGEVPEIRVNAAYLLEALAPVAGAPTVKLELTDERTPIRIQDGAYTALVMPMAV